MPLNWHNQGAEAGLYTNDDIHAVRILAMEADHRPQGRERGPALLQPRRRATASAGRDSAAEVRTATSSPRPDGNPDTSFLAKIPADVGVHVPDARQARHGAERGADVAPAAAGRSPHRLRRLPRAQPEADRLPAHARRASRITRCGTWSTHARSSPRRRTTRASRSGTTNDEAGLRFAKDGPLNVEYWRDIKPILDRSCVQCHTAKDGKEPAGNLNLDADDELVQRENLGKFPGTYYRLALDERAKFGHKPPGWDSWGYPNASRYVRKFQSRRSLLVWKIYGERLDGFSNDDHPSEDKPGSGKLFHKGEEVDLQKNQARFDLDYTGKVMPPATGRQAAHRRGAPHHRAVDRPRLPHRSRLRPEEPDEARLRLDARRPAADARADRCRGREEPGAVVDRRSGCTTTAAAWTWRASA